MGEFSGDFRELEIASSRNNTYLPGSSWVQYTKPDEARLFRSTVSLQVTCSQGIVRPGSTGVLIGRNTVLAAGHSIYRDNGWIKSAKVIPAWSPFGEPYGTARTTASANSFIAPPEWINSVQNGNANFDFDWAIIRLDRNIGDRADIAKLFSQSGNFNGRQIGISGYPYNMNILHRTIGNISTSLNRTLRTQNTKTAGGMSGGPVFLNPTQVINQAEVIAIHSGRMPGSNNQTLYNQHTRITVAMNQQFQQYKNATAQGDVNGDGVINTADANLILSHIAGMTTLTPAQRLRADVNGDGVVNIFDALIILEWEAWM
jgi:V8-like Glu-specific endopeptidase